jgi:uncharacterized protein (TIRG00374 family)
MGADPPRGATGTLLFLGKLVVSGALLGLLFWRVDRGVFLRTLQALPWPVFLGCVSLYALSYILSTIRWSGLLAAEGIRLPLWRLILIYFEGAFFNLFLPTLIGGDVVRGYSIYRITGGHPASIASILMDRLTGFAALMVIALSSLAFALSRLTGLQIPLLILAVAALFGLVLALLASDRAPLWIGGLFRLLGLARFQGKLQGLMEAVGRYRGHRAALLRAFLLSAVLQALIIVTYYLVGAALKIGVPLSYFFVFVPLITVVAMLPVSVAGLGVREGGVIYFFSLVGVEPATSLSMSLIWFAITVVVSSLGGPAFLLNAHHTKRTAE